MTTQETSLLTKLRRANMKMVALAMASAWLAISVIAYVNLRIYGDQNLALASHSIAYATQAAAVSGDTDSVRETLTLIGTQEKLASVEVKDASGRTLWRFQAGNSDPLDSALTRTAAWAFPQTRVTPIQGDGRTVGTVEATGNSVPYVEFFATTLAAAIVCLGGLAIVVLQLSHRIARDIVLPLDRLASLTHAVRVGREFNLRAPRSDVKEISQLGEDIDALLMEIERLESEREQHVRELQCANDKLGFQLRHDGLTGLPNRGYFQERLMGALAQSGPGKPGVAVLYVDIDHFKSINDRYGHAAGDEVLVTVGRRIRALLRSDDLVARLGGDEFGVLMGAVGHVDEAVTLAHQIVATMREPIPVTSGISIEASGSVGVGMYPDHAATLEELLGAADMAMYRVKLEHRNGARVAFSHQNKTTDLLSEV